MCTFHQAEMELNALGRKVQQLEETFENTEEKLKAANDQLVQVQHAGDESERYVNKYFSSKNVFG